MIFELTIDNRESGVCAKIREIIQASPTPCPFEINVAPLPIGDFVFSHNKKIVAIIERKSLSDLLSSIKDGRYEEQSYRLINTAECPIHNIIYVIEGMFSTLNGAKDKQVVLSAMTSLSHFKGFSVIRTCSTQETAELIVGFAKKVAKEYAKGNIPIPVKTDSEPKSGGGGEADSNNVYSSESVISSVTSYSSVVKKVKKENITKENIGEIILSQIPGISAITAKAIMNKFAGSFAELMRELGNPDSPKFADITYVTGGKTRKINRTAVESIRTFLAG